ncbi:hypothetical protein PMAYCL1PPCAC_28496 [Pristionchus mayeri]|uniref:RRM domain-containing protein n=1 Tax=Pristionchus mayeri TaxID=1317129 RepID=A0AAN5D8E7_9BILA|nr:hypothetical protein PMAYCL1PPCAC_28496 [Pristionchus mayeri]
MNPETIEQPEPSPLQNGSEPVAEGKPQHIRPALDDLPATPSPVLPPPPTPPLIPTEKRLHVNNIPFKWREDDLIRLFGGYGTTKHVEVVMNERGSKGFGFVTFVDAAAADQAMSELDGRVLDGRTIKVNVATKLRKYWEPDRVKGRNHPRHTGRNTDQRSEQCSSELGLLLMQQKQQLAQQQLQQFLAAKQQSDLIATVLGLPTSNLGGLLAGGGQLPYSALAVMPSGIPPAMTIDSLALQQQLLNLQSFPLLQQQMLQQPPPPPVFPPTPQNGPYGQVPTVSTGYTIPQMFPADGVKPEMGTQMMNAAPFHVRLPNEMGGSSSSFRSPSIKSDVPSQRYNPY